MEKHIDKCDLGSPGDLAPRRTKKNHKRGEREECRVESIYSGPKDILYR